MKSLWFLGLRSSLLVASWCALAHAGRPLITDDAGVVGERRIQVETWLYLDAEEVDHVTGAAYGVSDWLEVSVGGVYGFTRASPPAFGAWGPIVQMKGLLLEPEAWPGLALVIGGAPPLGHGHLEPPGWLGYGVANSTWFLFGESGAIHANVGVGVSEGDSAVEVELVAGLALDVEIIRALSAFVELYRGDVYDARVTSIAVHGGAYWSATEWLQIDATIGTTLPVFAEAGESAAPWGTLGAKFVTDPL